jgi:membrane associated rhomboid family serine protease
MTDTPPTTTENRCYRHPDRETFVKCQRCGRPICGQCQTLAPVGVHCPECVREARGSAASAVRPVGRRVVGALNPSRGVPIITYSIIAACVIVFVLECLTGLNPITGTGNSIVANVLAYYPHEIYFAPWSIISVNFVHANILHIALNMYSLFIVGTPLERFLGRGRYAALFFVSGIGAVVAVDLLTNEAVIGASGAIFGLLGALVVFARRMGLRTTQLYVVIAINLAIGFIIPQIAWQAHIGGLIVGVGLAFLMLKTSTVRRRPVQVVSIIGVTIVLVVVLLLNAVA